MSRNTLSITTNVSIATPNDVIRKKGGQEVQLRINDFFQEDTVFDGSSVRRVHIVGGPGSGKTTLAAKLGLTATREWLDRYRGKVIRCVWGGDPALLA
jgi:hypothetical protein